MHSETGLWAVSLIIGLLLVIAGCSDGGGGGEGAVFPADAGTVLVIGLNSKAEAALNLATGKLAIGLQGTTIVNRGSREGVRFSDTTEARTHQLVLNVVQ